MEKKSGPDRNLEIMFPNQSAREFVKELLNGLPNIVAILDEDRRLVYTNQATLDRLNITNYEKAFKLRPGEMFRCVNSDTTPGGCGSSDACQLCGAHSALSTSKEQGTTITEECKILAKEDGKVTAYNFRFTSTPYKSEHSTYFIISIDDLGSEKRKAELERIFYHDVMNSISGLYGIIELLKKKDKLEDIHLNILEETYKNLFDTINEQKEFSRAESGDLHVKLEALNSWDIVNNVSVPFRNDKRFDSVIEVSSLTVKTGFLSDGTLLSRILTNMVKNAMEASGTGDIVTIGAEKISEGIRFWVHNPTYIPKDNQLMMFERSFSTKGQGRGIGTFSMKLLGENYLEGNVDFSSSKEEGTKFWIDIKTRG